MEINRIKRDLTERETVIHDGLGMVTGLAIGKRSVTSDRCLMDSNISMSWGPIATLIHDFAHCFFS